MRPLSIGIPTGKVRMTLWAGTEDEESFEVRRLASEAPYVRAYGTKHPLTPEEIKGARELQALAGKEVKRHV